jgi:hypothetical protein
MYIVSIIVLRLELVGVEPNHLVLKDVKVMDELEKGSSIARIPT